MTQQISRRAQFVTTDCPDDAVATMRRNSPHKPISVGIMVVDQNFSNMVVATPRVDTDEQDICAPVPIQERLSADDSASNLATDLVYTLLATRVSRWDMHSLGYGYGQHRRGATCQKYGKCVFWFGFVVPSTVRRSGCAELSDVANFSSPIWIDIRRWHALHSGQVVSSSKARMVMQVTLALSAKVGVNNPIVAQAHRELSEQGTLTGNLSV